MSASFPHVDLAALLGAGPDDGTEAIVRAALKPFVGASLIVFDAELRLHLFEGPGAAAAGYDSDLVRGRSLFDVFPETVSGETAAHWRATLLGEHRSYEVSTPAGPHLSHCGPIRDAAGAVVGGACLTTEAPIPGRETADRYKMLTEASVDVVAVHDVSGVYRYASPSAAAILGYAPETLVGLSATDLIHADDLADVLTLVQRLIAGEDSGLATFRMRRADGTYRWLEGAFAPLRNPRTNHVREIRVTARDVTERMLHERRAADATAELRRRLAQTAAVARLGELAMEHPELGVLLDAAAQSVADTLEVNFTSVLELRGPNEPLIARAGIGWSRGLAGTLIEPGDTDHDAALALLANGPVVAGEERFRSRYYDEADVVSAAHALIGDPKAPWGVLSAASTEPRDFDPSDRDFLQAVAHVIGDAVARRRAEDSARHDALHDPLTGLPNRGLLIDRLEQALRRRTDGRVAVLVLDVDDFKVVNDSLGHGQGDQLLSDVGPRLADALRPGDTIARFSGDTFAVICEDIADETHAEVLAQRLTAAFTAPFVLGTEQVFATASVGVVVSGEDSRAADLVRDADAAMHRAKEAGAGRYELFDPRLRERAISRLRTETELRRALARDELRLHYQPFWELPGKRLAGVEALVRWQHPDRGLVQPGDFIPLAESSGLIVPIGTWVLREACRQLAAWRAENPAAHGLRLRVNLSARQVTDPDLIPTVRRALDDHGIEPAAVGLEITEGLLLQDSDQVAETLAGLKALGVGLVLDDFGTGYSSLSYLKRFPIDQLKIDRSFVAALEEEDGNVALVAAIVAMAGALDLTVVPEGVETEAQLETLIGLGCEYVQGFLLARPLEPAQVLPLLDA